MDIMLSIFGGSLIHRKMRIKKLEVQGFKSFPDKTRILFHNGITTIIGPNGTGKSNIVDALLYVLGARRLKSLRGEQRGDIIFNGNTEKAPMGMADVTLTLTDEEENLMVSRRTFRSGENEYRQDGKIVRLMDIQESLWQRGIGESQYFVIEQGTIGQFVTAKPLEKRSLLEEAAGTSLYKDKKRQAQNKLAGSEQNLERLEDVIAEVSRTKNSLNRQAAAAIRYRQLREDIRKLTAVNFKKRFTDLENELRTFAERLSTLKEKESGAVHRLREEEKKLMERRRALETLEQEIQTEQETLYNIRSQISRLEADRDRDDKRIGFLDEKKKGAESSSQDFQMELFGLDKEKKETEDTLAERKKEWDERKKALGKAEEENTRLQSSLAELRRTIDKLRSDYLGKLSEHTDIKNEKARAEKEVEMMNRQAEKMDAQVKSEQALLTQNTARLKDLEGKIALKQKERDSHLQVIEQARERMGKKEGKADALQDKKQAILQERDKNAHHLEVLIDLERKERAKDTSELIPETMGILADSIESDAEHAGLVDIYWSEEAAAHLIEADTFLGKYTDRTPQGRYLLLHPKGGQDKAIDILKESGVHGRLKSFIRPGSKLGNRLSQLGEAVVVENVRRAVELWLRRPDLDYISRKGDVLRSSGLLSVGEKKEGLIAMTQEIKSLKEAVAALEKKLGPIEGQIEAVMNDLMRGKEDIEKLKEGDERLKAELDEIESDRRFVETDLAKVGINCDVMERERKNLETERVELAAKLKTITSLIVSITEEESSLKETVEADEKRLAALQEEAGRKRNLFFDLKSRVDVVQEQIVNLEQRLDGYGRRKESLTQRKATLTGEIQTADTEKEELKKSIWSMGQKITALTEEKKEKENRLHGDQTGLKEMQAEIRSLEERLEKLREDAENLKEERRGWEVKKAEKDRDLVNLEEACWQELRKTLEEVKAEALAAAEEEGNEKLTLAEAREKLERIGSVNLMAEEEYTSQKKRYDFLIQERDDLTSSIASTREAIKKIDTESRTRFLKALEAVNTNFQEIFAVLFDGGKAEVKLSEPDDPLESGVDIVAQPPGKRGQSLNLLSGGEKSLTSLAFFFALFRYRPTPFCILDEVDAPLDEVNLGRFLNMMQKIKDTTQFIIVTHNFKTMEVADFIYGTTMAEPSVTSIYSVKLDPKTKKLQRR